jgi:hypothetical protein
MPLYRFTLDVRDVPEQEAEWHRDDVAALVAASRATADLARNRQDLEQDLEQDPEQEYIVLAVRVSSGV